MQNHICTNIIKKGKRCVVTDIKEIKKDCPERQSFLSGLPQQFCNVFCEISKY